MNIVISEIKLSNKDKTQEETIESFNLFQSLLPFGSTNQLIFVPTIEDETCLFNLKNISTYQKESNYNYTSILYSPTSKCISYIRPIENILELQTALLNHGYPPIASILITPFPNDRRVMGSPSTGIYDNFNKYTNISYILVTQPVSLDQFSLGQVIYYDGVNPWQDNTSTFGLVWPITFKAIKFLLITAQVVLCGFVTSRTKFKGKLQISLLLVGILQLGGELIMSLTGSTYQTISFYSSAILLPAAIVNSLVVLSWTEIVYRLNTRVVIKPFKFATIVESVLLNIFILLRIVLLVFFYLALSLTDIWFTGLNYWIVAMSGVIPLVMGGWFFFIALQFCPIFHSTAKLINAQWFTLFIMMTRVFFGLLLASDHLVKLLALDFQSYTSFVLLNNIAMIAYNTMIIMTVIKIQSISSVKQDWTPEKLGYSNNDGSLTFNESHDDTIGGANDEDINTNPFTKMKQIQHSAYNLSHVRSINSSTNSLPQ